MTNLALLLLLALGGWMMLRDWRSGLYFCLIVGFLQDPLRKATPGEPVYFVGLVGVALGLAVSIMVLRRGFPHFGAIEGWSREFAVPVSLLAILVLVQALRTFVGLGSPLAALIGVLAYLAPLPALLFAHHYAFGRRRITAFLLAYSVLCLAAVGTVYLSYLGFESPLLDEVGPGITIYDQGTVLEAHSGILRTSEVAAWHAATGVCFLLILATLTRRPGIRLILVLAMVSLVGAGVLTGRRKALVAIVLFATAYWFLLLYYRRGAIRLAVATAFMGLLLSGIALQFLDSAGGFDLYLRRSATVVGEAAERLQVLGLGSIRWSIERNGFFGAGAGAGSQGSQYFGGGASVVGGGAEGGLGKIAAELGVPGLVIVALLVLVTTRRLFRIMRSIARTDSSLSRLTFGLVAFLLANSFTFLVATQVYGDIFVLTLLGTVLGLVLAVPRLARHGDRIRVARRARRVSTATPVLPITG